MIAVDTHILIWGLRKQPAPGRPDLVERCEHLLRELRYQGEGVMIPSVVLAEYLCGCPTDVHAEVKKIIGRHFFIAPFDAHAAVITAELFKANSYAEVKESFPDIPRQLLKADYKIVATAIAAKASTLYVDDQQFSIIANKRITIKGVPLIDIPTMATQIEPTEDGEIPGKKSRQPGLPGMEPTED